MARARIRSIKPEIWQDEKVGDLSRDARLLLLGMLTMADDEGRLLATPMVILGHVFPFDDDAQKRLSSWICELVASNIVVSYEANGKPYLAFRHWRKHQRINRAVASTLPAPDDRAVVEENAIAESSPRTAAPRGRSGYRKKAIPEKTRREVARRNGATPGESTTAYCAQCKAEGTMYWPRIGNGKPGSWVQFTGLELDHIHPEYEGGSGEPDNIQLLCTTCNRRKGHRTGEVTVNVTELRDRGNGDEVA